MLRQPASGPVFAGSNPGDVATWDGTTWVPLPPAAGLPAGTAQNQILVWDGAQWVAGTLTARIHSDALGPIAHWPFQVDGNDIAGGGFDLQCGAGGTATPQFGPLLGGLSCVSIGDNHLNHWERPIHDSEFQLLGELTFMALVSHYAAPTLSSVLCAFGLSGELEANNVLYQFRFVTDDSVGFEYFWEDGAGVNNFWPASASVVNPIGVVPGQIYHVAITRDATQVIRVYLDGTLYATSPAQSAPTGGSAGVFTVGGDIKFGAGPLGTRAAMSIASAQMYDSALSDAQILAAYNYTLGGIKGLK